LVEVVVVAWLLFAEHNRIVIPLVVILLKSDLVHRI
jgi:hypothetical protein